MKSIDRMKAELAQAGYRVVIGDSLSEIVTPDGLLVRASFSHHEERAIKQAYAHLLKERQFAAMAAFIERVAQTETIDKIFAQNEHGVMYSEHPKLKAIVDEAKAILGK